ncbi:DUF481 domain-containing protein [Pseudofulvibacter geojedonensis]|uniref:DUF481 domain-containing protein n=1 Tax=Pseudofulvibacter geojedonensis TaxID=1123758 RepID=A0ABW3I542_9FLAO
MKLKLCLLFIVFVINLSFSQIVNVESLRRVGDSSKWSGYTSLAIDLTKNRNHIFNLKNRTHVQYLFEKNLVLFVNDIDFKEVNNEKLVSKGTQHLRYNYKFKPKFAWEIFIQSQYDEISAIDFRGLIGTGPRLTVYTSKNYLFYTGILSMYEYEEIENDLEHTFNRDFRNSSYISFSLFPKENIAIVSTTYYQPLYKSFSDYRISNDTSIALTIFKNLAFKIHFTYLFDIKPALGVPKEQYKLSNGLTYTFN